uniref:Uncharacterized protein n=1 Tax=Arundo donax TaxID=35708 RepID=A0A0A8Z1X5_ARUDO
MGYDSHTWKQHQAPLAFALRSLCIGVLDPEPQSAFPVTSSPAPMGQVLLMWTGLEQVAFQ